jgi:hypothetical protein
MATWWVSWNGPGSWYVWGGNITNHEAFAISPDSWIGEDIGLSITSTAVYNSLSSVNINGQNEPVNKTAYWVAVTPVDKNDNPLPNQHWSGTINSNGV